MKKSEIKEQFITKYSEEIGAIYEKYGVDTGVCMDILVAYARNIDVKDKQYTYSFNGCENVDLVELRKDIKILEDNFIIPTLA